MFFYRDGRDPSLERCLARRISVVGVIVPFSIPEPKQVQLNLAIISFMCPNSQCMASSWGNSNATTKALPAPTTRTVVVSFGSGGTITLFRVCKATGLEWVQEGSSWVDRKMARLCTVDWKDERTSGTCQKNHHDGIRNSTRARVMMGLSDS